jgi:cell division control protein 6
VLRSETYLTSNYRPEEPVGRETEIGEIADAVRPLMHRHDANNLIIFGPAGVGKTTCTQYVTGKLENQASVKSVYINCWQYNTRSSLLTELLIQLGYPAPRKGKPVDELLSKIREWLDKNRGVAVALDEFDQLDNQTEVIYDLQMINEEADNSIGLLMVSNQHPTRITLDPRSQSRLSCKTLEFQSYNAPQLEEILQDRVEKAFRPGTVTDDAIRKIAESVAENSGDCRKALKTLLRAGRKADREGSNKVTRDGLEMYSI